MISNLHWFVAFTRFPSTSLLFNPATLTHYHITTLPHYHITTSPHHHITSKNCFHQWLLKQYLISYIFPSSVCIHLVVFPAEAGLWGEQSAWVAGIYSKAGGNTENNWTFIVFPYVEPWCPGIGLVHFTCHFYALVCGGWIVC